MFIGKRKSLLLLFIGSLSVLAAAVAACEPTPGEQEPASATAPDFTVPTSTGDFQLAQQRGKITVLYFAFPN